MESLIHKNYKDLLNATANSVNIHNGEINTLSNMLHEDWVSRHVSPVTNISVTKDSCKDSYADDIIIITVYINVFSISSSDAVTIINKYTELYAKVVQGLDNTRVIVVPSKTDRETEVRVVSRRRECVDETKDKVEDNHKETKKTKKRV